MWRIYHGPEDWAEGAGHGPTGDQARGVQAILQHHPAVGWHIASGSDYYVWRDGRWLGVDLFGLYDYLLDTGLVLFGRTLLRDDYHAVIDAATAERARRRDGST